MQFLLGEKYNITFEQQVKSPGRAKPSTFQITLKNLMYHRQTDCFYYFWTGKETVRINKTKFVSAEQTD